MHKPVFLRFTFAAIFSIIFISHKHQHSRICLLSPGTCGKETSAAFVVLNSFGNIAFRSSGTTKKQGMYRQGRGREDTLLGAIV